jgi:hypothetical protein
MSLAMPEWLWPRFRDHVLAVLAVLAAGVRTLALAVLAVAATIGAATTFAAVRGGGGPLHL